jgi:hypothetical protein
MFHEPETERQGKSSIVSLADWTRGRQSSAHGLPSGLIRIAMGCPIGRQHAFSPGIENAQAAFIKQNRLSNQWVE